MSSKWPLSGVLYNRYKNWLGSIESFALLSVWLEISADLRGQIQELGWVYRCPSCQSNALRSGVDDAQCLLLRDNGSGYYSDWSGDMADSVLEDTPIFAKGRFSAYYCASEAFPTRHFGTGPRRGMLFRNWTVEESHDWRSGRRMMRIREGPVEQRPVALCSTCAVTHTDLFEAEERDTYVAVQQDENI